MAIFQSIWDDFRRSVYSGNMVTKLVIINFTVFVLVSLVYVGLFVGLGGNGHYEMLWAGLEYLCMPADWMELLWHPWTPFSYMFLHQSFWHVLSNIIWLYLFGTIVGDLIGDRRVLPLYLLGGLAGALTYFVSANILPFVGQHALGASASVMALGGAALVLAPDYRIMLFLLGEVKVKYIVLIMVLLDLIGFANQANTGGHAAHLGGLALGIVFVYQMRKGNDWAEYINNALEYLGSLFSPQGKTPKAKTKQRKPQMAYKASGAKSKSPGMSEAQELSFEEKLNAILDKIKKHGIDTLSQEEKDFLYDASKK